MNGGFITEIISGIYKIEDIETGAVYVGSANKHNGIKKRWSNHLARLRNGTYDYKQLQGAYYDNPDRIKFEILEECPDDELEERENYWIEYCKKIDGWTVINKRKAKRGSNVKDTSKMMIAQQGESNGHNTKLSAEDVLQIKNMLNDKIAQYKIAKKFDVSLTLISNIKNGHRWNCLN